MKLQKRIIRGDHDGPALLVTGGVHGDEFEPMETARRLIRQLDPASFRGSVTIVPVVNESAYWAGTRQGVDGLDLARTFPGKPDGSVTEQTADALTPLIQQADYYIDLHTGGTVLDVMPLVGYSLHHNGDVRAAQRRMARAFNMTVIWGTSPMLDGRSISVARDAEVPAIYAEWRGRANSDPRGVEAYFDGVLNVMAELGMIEGRRPPTSVVKYVVEDNRENAGYMQINYPAPMGGYFEPAVSLGSHVRVGDPLGSVCDVLGDNVVTVPSTQEGLVCTLRSYLRVNKGDCLGVVIELDASSKEIK